MKQEFSERKAFAGFIPHRLEIEGSPELSDFPLNVLFANIFVRNGVNTMASSLYEPDLETYNRDGGKKSLRYKNIHNPENTVTVLKTQKGWEGTKVINEREVLMATGQTWNQFFTQLTLFGLSKGERCFYESVDSIGKKNH